jgi:hypothetical protein
MLRPMNSAPSSSVIAFVAISVDCKAINPCIRESPFNPLRIRTVRIGPYDAKRVHKSCSVQKYDKSPMKRFRFAKEGSNSLMLPKPDKPLAKPSKLKSSAFALLRRRLLRLKLLILIVLLLIREELRSGWGE